MVALRAPGNLNILITKGKLSQNPGTKQNTIKRACEISDDILYKESRLNRLLHSLISVQNMPIQAIIAMMQSLKQNGLSPGIMLLWCKGGKKERKGIIMIGGLVNKKANRSQPENAYEHFNVNIAYAQILYNTISGPIIWNYNFRNLKSLFFIF
jgi:hypothetical protein